MSLNLVLAYEASALAAPPSFRDAMQAAANIFDSLILNNITVTIRVGYGDWNNQFSVPSTAAEGGDLVGVSESYATLRAALASHETSAADQTFVNSLPSTSSITGVNANGTPVTVSSFYVPSAVAKALGQISPTNSTVDGAVGFGTGIPTTLLVGVALHEFSHALGREPGVGPFDLFRYTSPGQHLFSGSATAPAAYFSIDGGQTDLADFGRTSDSSDFLNRGVQGANDPFNEFYSSSTLQNLTAVDKELIDVLGFNTTPGSITVSATSSKAQQGGAAVTLLSGAPTITDAASSTLASATIKITSGSGSGSAVAGDKLYVNGQQSGTVDGGLVAVSWNDSTKVLTLTGTASISAYQTLLSQVSYQDTGTDSSTGSHPQRTVSWTANDGSSSFSAASQIAIERSPVVTASNVMLNAGYMLVAATSLFSASDPDNDAIVTYGFKDTGTGHFVLGGTAQPNNIEIDVTASQLPQLSYQNAPGTDTVQIRASDGTMWSNWASFTVTGPAVKVVQTDGPTSLTEVGNHFYLFDSNGLGPSLKIGGMDFVAGQFGAWTPIGAAMAAGGGYEVAWKNGNADQYTVWNTNSNGNYTSSVTGWVPGSDVTLESLEPSFQQDLNGDGVIGLRTTVLEAHGSTSLVQVGSNYFLYPVGGSSGPSLKFGGMDVVAGQFGAWTPIGAEATASGYEIAWKNGTADQYTVWNTNSSGNYTSSAIGVVSGSSVALASLEGSFQQDLNDDGLIGPSAIFASRVATGLTQPLFAGAPAGDTGRLFIVEKTGRIKILDLASGQVLATPFLDLSGQIDTSGERGLLGLAFDPNFATNGFVYVDVSNPNGNNDIRRYHVDPTNPNVVDLTSATPILSINQSTFNNHKGGWLGFGPDGDLYISVGDGGGGGNPLHTGQNIDSLLGKILRIDVHSPSDPGLNYHIPSDNPFVGTPGADEEIFAYGLRNPWRASFDRALGTFYIADVGQDSWEEIDIGQKGANYGWNTYEGPVAFPGGDPLNPAGPSVSPIYSYDHSVGHSITGGYVYRGEGEGLQGQYFFADFIQSKVFTLRFDGSSWVATDRTAQIVTDAGTIHNPDSFGEDARGNLYIVDYDGNIFKLTPSKLLPTVIEAHGSTSLVQVGNNYFLYPVGGSSGPELSFGGAPVVAGQFAAWMPIAAEVTAKGYEVAWKNGSADQYTVWNTNSSGNYTSSVTGWVPGNNLTLESLEPSFQQALNNDGTIGPPPPPPPTVIESKGATDLDQVGSNYFLYAHGTTNGPELSFGGMPVVAGQFGAWTPIGAEVMANGRYEVAWKNGSADQYTVWNTDSGGNYASNVVGWVLGNNLTLESLEPSFQQDLNGDGTIGPPPPPPPTVIESKGATDLDQVGSNYFLYAHGTTNGPELSFGGMPVVAGQFGPWTPIGAEVMASGGYEVAWKNGSADQYTVWNTNSSGSFISSIAIVSGRTLRWYRSSRASSKT
jgi:glucose/arabinose dehydrogenase